MALSGYNIRFIMSVQNNTRNGMSRVISDMRRLSKVERELAQGQKHYNELTRQSAAETANLQRRLKTHVTAYNNLYNAQARTRKQYMQQGDAVRKLRDRLAALNATELRLNATRRDALARARKAGVNSLARASARDRARAANIDLKRLPGQRAQIANEIRRAETAQKRLNHLQMRQLAGLKLNKKEQLEILGLLERQALVQAQIAAEQTKMDARQARRDTLIDRQMSGRAIADVGRAMQLRGLLATGALGWAAHYASSFQTDVTKAATQVRPDFGGSPTQAGIAENTARMSQDILNMMGKFPAKANEMTDSAYQIFSSMNVGYEAGISLLEVFNSLAVAGATDLKTATSAGITLFNNFGGTAAENAKVLDQTFAIIRLGRMEFDDFNNMLNQVAPAAKQAGQSLTDVGGAMAFLTTRMPSQRMAAVSLARLLEIYSRSDFRAGMQKLGKSIEDDQHNLLPLPEIMKKVSTLKMAQSESGLSNLIPFVTMVGRGSGRGIEATAQGRRGQAFLIKDLKAYLDIQKQVVKSQREFKARYEAMLGTPQVKWERFLSLLQSLTIQLGNYLLPLMVKLAAYLSTGIDWVKQHQGIVKWTAAFLAAYAAINLFGGMLLNVFGTIKMLYNGFLLMNGGATLFAGGGLKAMTIGMARFVGLAVAAYAAIGALRGGIEEASRPVDYSNRGHGIVGAAQRFNRWMGGSIAGMVGTVSPSAKKKIIDIMNEEDPWNPFGNVKKNTKNARGAKKTVESRYNDILKALKNAENAGYNKKVMDAWAKAMGIDPVAMEKFRNSNGGTSEAANLARSIKEKTKEITNQVRSALEGIYTELEQSNQTVMGDIFQGRWLNSDKFKYFEQFGIGPNMGDLIKDAQVQLGDFATSQKVFNKLRKRGISEAFIQDLKNMGPEGYKYIKALLNGSDKQLKQYVGLVNKRKQQVDAQTRADFKRRIDDWKKHGGNLATGLATGFDSQKLLMYNTITNAIQYAFSGAIAEMARVQAVAEQTANAVANAAFMNASGTPTSTGTTSTSNIWWMRGKSAAWILKNYPKNPGTHPYGNPGVWRPYTPLTGGGGSSSGGGGGGFGGGTYVPPSKPSQGAVNAPDNRPRRLSSAGGDTHIYNITGFSPEDALRAAQQKRAFRDKNRRR